MQAEVTRNQCDGCMNGSPIENGLHRFAVGKAMVCQARRYATPECGTLSKFYMDGLLLARKNQWRYGQALFNLLVERHPFLAESIRGTNRDPFHMEGPASNFDQWDRFATFIEKNWY